MRLRPDVVITTGAAPGYFAVRIGKLLGARVVWVDSIANAEELSLSGPEGRLLCPISGSPNGPTSPARRAACHGSVLVLHQST